MYFAHEVQSILNMMKTGTGLPVPEAGEADWLWDAVALRICK